MNQDLVKEIEKIFFNIKINDSYENLISSPILKFFYSTTFYTYPFYINENFTAWFENHPAIEREIISGKFVIEVNNDKADEDYGCYQLSAFIDFKNEEDMQLEFENLITKFKSYSKRIVDEKEKVSKNKKVAVAISFHFSNEKIPLLTLVPILSIINRHTLAIQYIDCLSS